MIAFNLINHNNSNICRAVLFRQTVTNTINLWNTFDVLKYSGLPVIEPGAIENMTDLVQATPDMANFTIGIIGMGDMGKMYARRLSDAGWR